MGFKLIIIFAAVLFIDGLLLPAFFGLRESFLSLLVLVAPVLYAGSTRQFIVYGLVFALISESMRGLNFGDMAMPFLFTAVMICLTQRFLDIKYTYDTRFGLGKSALVALMSVAFIYVFSFLFRQGSIDANYFDTVIGLTVALEALVLVFVFNLVFNKKSDYL